MFFTQLLSSYRPAVAITMLGFAVFDTAALATRKLTFATDILTTGGSLAVGTEHRNGAASSNGFVGLFAGGSMAGNKTTQTYNLATDTTTIGPVLNGNRNFLGAVSSPTDAFLAGGFSPTIASIDKFNYDTRTVAASGSLSAARNGVVATGTKELAVFHGGATYPDSFQAWQTDATDRYVYSTNVRTPSIALGGGGSFNGAAAGAADFGVFEVSGSGGVGYTRVYSYATATVVAGGRLRLTDYGHSGVSNPNYGYMNGQAAGVGVTDKYNFATHAVAPTTFITYSGSNSGASGFSTNSGGLFN